MDVDGEGVIFEPEPGLREGSLLRQWLAGGLANALTSELLNPLDVAKTRMQTGGSPSLRGNLVTMWASGGLRGLFWPGLTASMTREMLSSGPRAGFYTPARDFFRTTLAPRGSLPASTESRDAAAKVLAALTTGTLGSVIANPVDVVKIRLMRDPQRYPSLFSALLEIARAEGFTGLYRGLVPSTLRGACIAAGELATYDIVKSSLRRLAAAEAETLSGGGGGPSRGQEEEGVALHVAASLVTGAVASVVAAPFDLIKTRAMSGAAPSQATSIAAVVRALAAEGGFPLSLFRGVLPAYLRLGPHALICFPLFEQLRVLLGLGNI
jgi:hypothetical protein